MYPGFFPDVPAGRPGSRDRLRSAVGEDISKLLVGIFVVVVVSIILFIIFVILNQIT
jgi:hypothetical protein